jgi:hypothetical protein
MSFSLQFGRNLSQFTPLIIITFIIKVECYMYIVKVKNNIIFFTKKVKDNFLF